MREFFKRKARDLRDHVINAGLERGRRGAAGDFIAQLIEREADGELGGDFCDREAGRFRRQRRRTRHARVHFNDDHAAVVRIDRKLHVRAARVDADLAQHCQRGIAHDLVFLVRQRLRRRDRDRVAGMYAHRVKVFNRADDDAIVFLVAHDFHLVLFPADQRFFNQQLGGRRGFQAALANRLEFFSVVCNAAAGAAHRERWPDDDREAELALHAPGFFQRMRHARTCRAEADLRHRLLEFRAVFRLVDRFRRCANQLALVFFEHAVTMQVERAIERRLAAHGRQDCVRLFLGDDALDELPGDRLDVRHVRHLRIRHDGSRIAVDENDAVTLFAQGLASLRAGVVEFTRLANNDRTCADDQDTFQITTFRHFSGSPSSPQSDRTKGRCRSDPATLPDDPGSRKPACRCAQNLAANRRTAIRG